MPCRAERVGNLLLFSLFPCFKAVGIFPYNNRSGSMAIADPSVSEGVRSMGIKLSGPWRVVKYENKNNKGDCPFWL